MYTTYPFMYQVALSKDLSQALKLPGNVKTSKNNKQYRITVLKKKGAATLKTFQQPITFI